MPASTALLPTLHSIPVWSVGATAEATRIPLLLDKKELILSNYVARLCNQQKMFFF